MARLLIRDKNKQGIAIIWRMVAMPLFFAFFCACGGEKKEFVDLSENRHVPMMKTLDMFLLVSDSGITRYKVEAAEWYIYEGPDPYWYFPEKIHVEKFDTLFRIEASIDADTAYFYSDRDLWRIIGNVEVKSLEGERFETSELFWDQKKEELYSDKYIKITKGDFINTGIGFKSNQTLTQYQIYQSGAEIPFNERSSDTVRVESVSPE
ncbi:MAG: LPS export ABC transporter periplasmic protein LptC [Tannerella sp.]|jgi:LPS export ABC transporter protein LptC|nr:LPS export ABC transporter periplasmic protein LptC [Tannerella sp.]